MTKRTNEYINVEIRDTKPEMPVYLGFVPGFFDLMACPL